jgi:antirestriction protein ArdC
MAREPKTEFAKFRQQVTDEIIAAMETGDAPWQKPWSFSRGSTPHNGFRKNAYRGGNAIWLAFDMVKNNFRDGRYVTLNQAAQMGERDRGRAYELRAGERDNFRMVEFWKMKQEAKAERNDDPGADGEKADAEEKVGKSTFPLIWRAYRVYHVSQFDGIPDLAPPALTWDPHERAEQLLGDSGATIRYGGNRAFYSLDTDHIQLPRREQFPTADNFYATAMHESIHWSGAPGRTNRHVTLGIRDGETDGIDLSDVARAKEELRAELGAAFLCAELGIAHDPQQHAAYLKSWIKALKDDRNELFRAASDASRGADYLLSLERERAVEPEREPSISVTVPDLAGVGENDPMLEAYYKHMIADWRGFNPEDEAVVRAFIAQRQRETPRAHHILDVYSGDELHTMGLLVGKPDEAFMRSIQARLDVARAAGIADDINRISADARIEGGDIGLGTIEAVCANHRLARVFASDNGKAILVGWPTLVVYDNATNAWRPDISASLFDRVAQQHRERDRDEQERIAAEPRSSWPSGYIDVDAIRRSADIMDLDRRVADDVLYQLRLNPPTASQIVLGYSTEDFARIGMAADVADLDAQIVERIVDAYNEQRAQGIANALTDAVNGFTTEQRTAILLDHNVLTTVTDPEGNDILVQRPYMVSWNGGTRWDVLTDLKLFHDVAEGAIERGAEAMRDAESPSPAPAPKMMYEVWWYDKGTENYVGTFPEQFATQAAAEKWAKSDGKHRGLDARVVEQPANPDVPIHGAALGGADETPQRERPAMDPDKVATRTDLRVHSFISRLTAQERTPGQLWSFCMNEVRTLKNELAMTTVRSELTAYRKAITDLDPDHPALAYIRPSRADQSHEAEASRERAYGNLRPTIAEVPAEAFKERTEMLLRSTGNYAALTAGVMAATGRRLTEIVRDGDLTIAGARSMTFVGSQKDAFATEPRVIPTLASAELVQHAWSEIKNARDYEGADSREINAKLGGPIGTVIKRTFGDIVPGITPKELRPIYAALTFAEANMARLFVDHYADVLGHDTNNPTAAYGNLKYIADTVDRDAFGENVRASHDVMVERQLAKLDAHLTAAARNGIQRDLTHLGWADPAAFIAEAGDPDTRNSVLIVGSDRTYSDTEHVRYDHAATTAEAIAKIEAAGSVGFDEMVIGPAARDLATYLDEHRGLPIGKVYLGYEPNAPEPDLAGLFSQVLKSGYAVFLDAPAPAARRTLDDVQNELLAEGKSITHCSRSSGKVLEIRDDFIVQDIGRDEIVVIDANLVTGERPAVGTNVTFAKERDGNISVAPIVEEEVEIAR